MSLDDDDIAVQHKMRSILEFAKQQLPGSIICIFSFTEAESDPMVCINKVSTNARNREALAEEVTALLEAMKSAEVIDLFDVQGGMQ